MYRSDEATAQCQPACAQIGQQERQDIGRIEVWTSGSYETRSRMIGDGRYDRDDLSAGVYGCVMQILEREYGRHAVRLLETECITRMDGGVYWYYHVRVKGRRRMFVVFDR